MIQGPEAGGWGGLGVKVGPNGKKQVGRLERWGRWHRGEYLSQAGG